MTKKSFYSQPDTNITLASNDLLVRNNFHGFILKAVYVSEGVARVTLDGEEVGTVIKQKGFWYPEGRVNFLNAETEICIPAYTVARSALGI